MLGSFLEGWGLMPSAQADIHCESCNTEEVQTYFVNQIGCEALDFIEIDSGRALGFCAQPHRRHEFDQRDPSPPNRRLAILRFFEAAGKEDQAEQIA